MHVTVPIYRAHVGCKWILLYLWREMLLDSTKQLFLCRVRINMRLHMGIGKKGWATMTPNLMRNRKEVKTRGNKNTDQMEASPISPQWSSSKLCQINSLINPKYQNKVYIRLRDNLNRDAVDGTYKLQATLITVHNQTWSINTKWITEMDCNWRCACTRSLQIIRRAIFTGQIRWWSGKTKIIL